MSMHVAKDGLVAFQNHFKPINMLRDRIAIVVLLFPVVAWVFAEGGWLFTSAISFVLLLAAYEFGQLFRAYSFRPSMPLITLGTLFLTFARFLGAFEASLSVLTLLILVAMIWHAVDFECGAPRSGTDFTITIAGVVYLGWIGSYLVSLRELPDGKWWVLIALPTVWLADSAAYFVGKWIGKHRLAPRLSPNKSWEGYLAGILAGALSGYLLALLWRVGAGTSSTIDPGRGLLIGAVLATIAPFGDLGVSMIKREFNAKDTGGLIPGHGGALDRLDTWIWAGVLGFYIVQWFIN
jgi:phosphatidate cytidylyltransferase